jgi:AcrR family transcriptional regulator
VSRLPFDPALGAGIEGRRHELFRLAAPVFRARGYRGTTIKALAHACHLSPAALYHYFPSKAAFATFLIDEKHLDWDSTHIDPDIDPLVQLRMTVDLVIDVLPAYLLAVDLAREVGRPLSQPQLARFFGQGEAIFGRVIAAAASGLGPDHGACGRPGVCPGRGNRCPSASPHPCRRRCGSVRRRDGARLAPRDWRPAGTTGSSCMRRRRGGPFRVARRLDRRDSRRSRVARADILRPRLRCPCLAFVMG